MFNYTSILTFVVTFTWSIYEIVADYIYVIFIRNITITNNTSNKLSCRSFTYIDLIISL